MNTKNESLTYPNLSNDYHVLYNLLLEGKHVAAFVDNDVFDDNDPARDICIVKRFGDFDIVASARGIMYFSVYGFNKTDGVTEEQLFVSHCKASNLRWIP